MKPGDRRPRAGLAAAGMLAAIAGGFLYAQGVAFSCQYDDPRAGWPAVLGGLALIEAGLAMTRSRERKDRRRVQRRHRPCDYGIE
jgi:hypothetical protein